MRRSIAAVVLAAAVTLPTAALAYVGPGAGLSLLGALWAFVAALGIALIMVAAWPVRRMLRRRRERDAAADRAGASEGGRRA